VTSYAERAGVDAVRTRTASKPRRSERAARGRSTTGGVVWIAVLTVLLAGVVAVNVAVLRLNMKLDRASQRRVELQADVASLQSALSTAAANAEISKQGQRKLGLVPADPAKTTYLQLAP
jgi:ABC-type Fe3+ transport system permease subunit